VVNSATWNSLTKTVARKSVVILLCTILVYLACTVTKGPVSLLLRFLALAAFPASFWSKLKVAGILFNHAVSQKCPR
jgi:hypothetical protein